MQVERMIDELKQIGVELRRLPSVKTEVMRQIAQHSVNDIANARRRITWVSVVAAIAACAAIGTALFLTRGEGGAPEAFAAAIDDVAKSRTFSCRQIVSRITDGKEEIINEESVMFKEPDRERLEILAVGSVQQGQFTITDYGKHRQLVVLEKDKLAALEDINSDYSVDIATGELKPTKLNTFVRDDVMRITAQAVVDLGTTTLEGRAVRQLQSKEGEPVKTVYVDPKTGLPIQISLVWPSQKRSWTYASIQIDVELDDSLFSLDVPKGFKLWRGGLFKPNPDYDAKMMTKLRFLDQRCYMYAGEHQQSFPESLADLTTAGLSQKALAALLAAPDSPDGPPVILYHKPRPGKDPGREIVVYEDPDHRQGVIAAAMVDGHAEVLTKEQFEKAMK